MTFTKSTGEEKLSQFMKQYVDDQHCLELLRFFGGYPRARFSELAVVHALNSNYGKLYTRKAIRQLIDKGMIQTSTDNNICFYSLTNDESLSSLATDLAKLDWHQCWLALRQTLATSAV